MFDLEIYESRRQHVEKEVVETEDVIDYNVM